jgi:hypothetical protein
MDIIPYDIINLRSFVRLLLLITFAGGGALFQAGTPARKLHLAIANPALPRIVSGQSLWQ